MKHWQSLTATVTALMLAGTVALAQREPPQPQPLPPERGLSNQPAAARPDRTTGEKWQEQLEKIAQSPADTACDKLFILGAAIGNQFEVEISRLADRKSQNDEVKLLARRIIQDHQQAFERLQAIAQKQDLEIPQTLPKPQQTMLQIMESLDAKTFDQHYVAAMDSCHAQAVACLQHATQLSKSADVKQFASQNLPKCRQHQQAVRQVATAVGLDLGADAQPAAGKVRAEPRDADAPPGTVDPERKPDNKPE